MGREIWHSILLVLVIALGFLFPRTPLAQFDLQITAVLFIIYFLAKRFTKNDRLLESTIFTLIIFIIVNTTGGLTSPFFFLLYFLLFGLTLLLEPVISIVATLTAIIFFLLTLPPDPALNSIIPILSLGLLSPFAMFMGQQYLRNEKMQQDTFLFLSLMLKNHLRNLKEKLENFMGDKELSEIKRTTAQMEKLIEKFEKEQ